MCRARLKPEGNNPVGSVVPDIGPAEVGNAAARAPIPHDGDFVSAEGPVVFRHFADPPEPQSGDIPQVLSDVEEQAVDSIKMLGHFFDHDHMAGKIRSQVGADQHGERGQVESRGGTPVETGFETVILAFQPVERARDRFRSTLAPDIARQRPMRHTPDPVPIERAEQESCVRIAEIGFGPRGPVHLRHRLRGDAVRTIPAHGKPYRIETGIVGTLQQRRQAYLVATGKVPFFQETLLMEVKRDITASRHKSFQRIGPFALQRFSGGTDRNFDHLRLLARLYRPAQLNSCTAMSDMPTPDELFARPFFFCGIGGSGMLPLAQILKGRGCTVEGSDRSRDQGRTPEKFGALEQQGFTLHPQDGRGIVSGDQILVASAAIEDTVPEVQRARELDCLRLSRAELNSILFNTSGAGLAVAGTSGKSTVTGMLGWILHACGREPTIMNGAVMKNFVSPERPYTSAVVGGRSLYVSEVDESDGSIALYRPAVGVLLNVSLDHKSMEELRQLFGDYLARSRIGVINADDAEALALLPRAKEVITFGIEQEKAQIGIVPGSIAEGPMRQAALVIDRHDGSEHALTLKLPGRHNLSNALAAIAGAAAAGIPVEKAVEALAGFEGLARRFEVVGTSVSAITVIDDFGHNPEKCAATLRTLKAHPGRVLAFFQPHGYGPLRQMGDELAQTFAEELSDGDRVILCDPVYYGGTVDRSEGSERIVRLIGDAGGHAEYIPSRKSVGDRLATIARPGDRIVIMGARDDTLSTFARELLAKLP